MIKFPIWLTRLNIYSVGWQRLQTMAPPSPAKQSNKKLFIFLQKYITKYENLCVKEWMLDDDDEKKNKKRVEFFSSLFFRTTTTKKEEKSMPATAELCLCYYVGSPFSWYFPFFHFFYIQKQTLIIK